MNRSEGHAPRARAGRRGRTTHAGRAVKIAHTLSAAGMTGAVLVHLSLLVGAPDAATSPAAYAGLRGAIAITNQWVLLPSLAICIFTGIVSMLVVPAYRGARWAWVKALFGISVFEGTLVGVQGPAVRAAEASAAARDGTLDPDTLAALVRGEWGTLWVILVLLVLNYVLGIWRPALMHPLEREARALERRGPADEARAEPETPETAGP